MTEHTLPPPNRIVTGHDEDGKAIVLYNGPAQDSQMRFNGPRTTLFWGTDSLPATNFGDEDIALRADEVAPPANGSWFRIVDYPPGFPGRRHKQIARTVPCQKILAHLLGTERSDRLDRAQYASS